MEVGKVADMVILSKNPYDVLPSELNTIKVLKAIYGGKEYKKQNQSILSIIMKGMFYKQRY